MSTSTWGAGTTGWVRGAGRSDLYWASGEDSGDIGEGYTEQAHQDVKMNWGRHIQISLLASPAKSRGRDSYKG